MAIDAIGLAKQGFALIQHLRSEQTQPVLFLDNETLKPVLNKIQCVRLDVTDEKTVTKFEVETGETINDHVITKPILITVGVMLAGAQDRAAFEALREWFNAHKLLTMQTRMNTYPDMLIEAMPHTEQVALNTEVEIRLTQWREVVPAYGEIYQARNKSQAKTKDAGQKKGEEPKDKQSVALKLAKSTKEAVESFLK